MLVHGLEHADNARQTLREVWRLLKDDGRLIVVVPNRQGMWAYWENSPFGYGQPYSKGQLARLLVQPVFSGRASKLGFMRAAAELAAAAAHASIYGNAWGHSLTPQFAGLTIAEATKDLHAVIPVKRQPARRRVMVDASN